MTDSGHLAASVIRVFQASSTVTPNISVASRLIGSALTLLLPASLVRGQSTARAGGCLPVAEARQTLALADGRRITVDVTGAAAKDSEVALVGTPTALWNRAGVSLDSLMGVTWSLGRGAAGIPIPNGRRPIFSKIVAASSGWDVVFFESSKQSPGGTLHSPTLWYGRYDGAWKSVRQVADLAEMSVDAGFASEFVSYEGNSGLLLSFEREVGGPSADRTGFLLITRSARGEWSILPVPARAVSGFVTLSAGLSPSQPFLLGVIELPSDGGQLRAPSLGLRLQPNDNPIWFGDGRTPVRTPGAVLIENRVLAVWSTSAERRSMYYASKGVGRSDSTPTRRLPLPVDDARLIGLRTGALLLGLEPQSARTMRIWWLDGQSAALRDSLVFSRTVFKYSAVKAPGGRIYVAALQVPSSGIIGEPSMEVVTVTTRCGGQETPESTQSRRQAP